MKKTQVIWSTEALVDLEIIYDFLAEKSIVSAQQIIENILARIKQIENFPESGTKQKTLRNTARDFRYLVEGNYKIIYSYLHNQKVVYVEIIFDTRHNPEALRV